MRAPKRPIHTVTTWVRRQPPKVKAFLAVVSGMAALVLLRFVVHDHDNLFVAAEAVHSIGIGVLIYKLMKEKTCAGLSLKTQELTAIFLAVRLYCSFVMEYDIHTLLDMATLVATLWVIYMIRFNLRSSYMEEKDNFAIYHVLGPCLGFALLIHPSTSHHIVNRISWAFCVYLEAVSVLPQLRVMQNTKIVEPFTAHYVFALGVARFLSCAHWVLQVLDTRGHLLVALGYGLWPSMVLISEIVQTFILADFCYYYIKRFETNSTAHIFHFHHIPCFHQTLIQYLPAACLEDNLCCDSPPEWCNLSKTAPEHFPKWSPMCYPPNAVFDLLFLLYSSENLTDDWHFSSHRNRARFKTECKLAMHVVAKSTKVHQCLSYYQALSELMTFQALVNQSDVYIFAF